MPDGPRYEDDFYAWTQHQAEVLRSMPVSDNRFDREHIAEEIEDLGKSERDAVRSQIRRIIEHFLKLAHSRAEQPRFDWMETIDDAREMLSDKLMATLRRDARHDDEPRAGSRGTASRTPPTCCPRLALGRSTRSAGKTGIRPPPNPDRTSGSIPPR